MLTTHRAVVLLRAFLSVLFAVLVMFQTFSLPGQFAHMAEEHPDLAYLRWPMTAVAVFWVLCIQVVVVCTWRLLSLVEDDRIFTEMSLAWVDGIVTAVVAAGAVLLGVDLYVATRADDPGLPLLLFLLSVGVAVFGLVLLVMRALLRQATALRTDLEAVI
jgi:Protein of unknown function (DUF2975)